MTLTTWHRPTCSRFVLSTSALGRPRRRADNDRVRRRRSYKCWRQTGENQNHYVATSVSSALPLLRCPTGRLSTPVNVRVALSSAFCLWRFGVSAIAITFLWPSLFSPNRSFHSWHFSWPLTFGLQGCLRVSALVNIHAWCMAFESSLLLQWWWLLLASALDRISSVVDTKHKHITFSAVMTWPLIFFVHSCVCFYEPFCSKLCLFLRTILFIAVFVLTQDPETADNGRPYLKSTPDYECTNSSCKQLATVKGDALLPGRAYQHRNMAFWAQWALANITADVLHNIHHSRSYKA